VQFEQITLVGVGLLGGSLGLAVKKRGLAGRVVGLVRRPESVIECRAQGVVDDATLDTEAAIKGADLIVHCAPVSQMRTLTEGFLPFMKPNAIVTDVGSVKASVVEDLEPLIADRGGHFVGSHPMAGGEQTGVGHSRADLFEGATVVITPTAASDPEALSQVESFWAALDANVLSLEPTTHDALVSKSSHLPHVAAAALATAVLNDEASKDLGAVCGPGFRDATRIASGSPSMWRDIVLQNSNNVSQNLGSLIRQLEAIKSSLDAGDQEAVEDFFKVAKKARDAWLKTRGDQQK